MSFRGGLGICGIASAILAFTFIACSDDDSSSATGADGGPDGVGPNPTTTVNPPPPPPNFPDGPAPPPDLQSRSGFLGNATLVADVGEPTDGPAWRTTDDALYFTVPGSANPLRRLVPGGTPTIVSPDAGAFAPIGIANSGGTKLYLTEREAVVTLDIDDAGAVTSFTRMAGLGGTVFGDIHSVPPEPTSYFVDIANTRLYEFVPPNQMSLLLEIPDGGKTSSIAARNTGATTTEVFVGSTETPGNNGFGAGILVYTVEDGNSPDLTGTVDLQGIPANGIAIDSGGRLFVAWADGIDVVTYTTGSGSGKVQRQSDGHAALPIGAIPTSLAFGGTDFKTLFVTTRAGKIYSIQTQAVGRLR